ncbi:MAG: hypothetical protein JWL86_731 [Rhizobium sp.]|nr:hypothetical protein [Rhizobium sp.]
MFATPATGHDSKTEFYSALCEQAEALFDGESDPIANAANLSALVFELAPGLNWVGFYFLKSAHELVLGPFQGKVACVRIAVGKGVCGTAAAEQKTVLVPDVHDFPGHIACDAASRSELVVPLIRDGKVFGVFDIDSPFPGRFDADDRTGFERLAAIYVVASHPMMP